MENTKSNTTTIVSVALAGAAVGALLGILFAPDKGSATRQKLSG
ncbi:MAG: YtxH domain-containing protein [Crocinitomicaceae bacterium]|nr:YtxH domain-containing protein [Crocinitomicaceae bacterium]